MRAIAGEHAEASLARPTDAVPPGFMPLVCFIAELVLREVAEVLEEEGL